MLYPVLIQEREDGKYEASVPSIPGLVRTGGTRDAALREIREAIARAVAGEELAFIDVPTPDQKGASPADSDADGRNDPLVGLFDFDDPSLGKNAEEVLKQLFINKE